MFFYNPSTRTSVWEKPDELKNRPDVDKLLSSTPGEKKDEVLKDESRSGSDKKKRSDSYVEEPPVKKPKSDDDAGTVDEPVVVKEQPPVVKDTAMEAEVKAAQQRAIIPLEERVQQFKEMLAEKEVCFVYLDYSSIPRCKCLFFHCAGVRILNVGKGVAQNRIRFPLPFTHIKRE